MGIEGPACSKEERLLVTLRPFFEENSIRMGWPGAFNGCALRLPSLKDKVLWLVISNDGLLVNGILTEVETSIKKGCDYICIEEGGTYEEALFKEENAEFLVRFWQECSVEGEHYDLNFDELKAVYVRLWD